MIIETVEGEHVYINEKLVTSIRKDKNPRFRLYTLACGTQYRTEEKIYNFNGEDVKEALG